MTTPQLITLKEIAKELGVPESSIRKYREIFNNFIPGVGAGRARRYREDAVEVFRDIRNLREEMNMPWEAVTAKLAEKYPMNVVVEPAAQGALDLESDSDDAGAVSQRSVPQAYAPVSSASPAASEAQLRKLVAYSERQAMMVNAMALEMLRNMEQYREESAVERQELIGKLTELLSPLTPLARKLNSVGAEEKLLLREAIDHLDNIHRSMSGLQASVQKSMRLEEVRDRISRLKDTISQKDHAIVELQTSLETMRRELAEMRLARRTALPVGMMESEMRSTHPDMEPRIRRDERRGPKKTSLFDKIMGRR